MTKKLRWTLIVICFAAGLLVLLPVVHAFTAANTVPQSRADSNTLGLGVNDLRPPECAGLILTNLVDVGAGETGTAANDLILGTPGDDTVIRGGAGDDCILGGSGDERRWFFFFQIPGLFGDDGDDVLIGGPGLDVCFGGAGNDQYYQCEITY